MLDYQCNDCNHRFNIPANVRRLEYLCPKCDSSHWALIKQHAHYIKPDLNDFSSENGGRGRYNPQTKMYHKNVREVIDEGKRRGWDATT